MRSFLPSLVLVPALAGCAGHVADYIGSRSAIIAPELPRYGLNLRESECVAERLGETLTPRQLRLLTRSAAAVTRGYFEPGRLTLRDLLYVAEHQSDRRVLPLVRHAAAGCGVTEERTQAETAPSPAPEPDPDPEAAPAGIAPQEESRPPTWLNLGSAGSGQAIAVDGPSVRDEGERRRSAWFRMVDPAAAPSPAGISYRLRIDCAARTIEPLARRRHDESGAIAEYRVYAPGEERPVPIENGTVTEIAYLSICT